MSTVAQPAKAPTVTLANGQNIPIVGLGTWKSPAGKVYDAVKTAIVEGGYRHIDCALVYGNEAEIGKALKEIFAETNITRDDIFITSKLWNTFHSEGRALECIQTSLDRLGLKQLDLYLIHWPMGYEEGDDLFPRDSNGKCRFSDIDYVETWKAMEDLVKNGLTKSIGLSNFNEEQIERILEIAQIKPVMNQIEVHPYLTNRPIIDYCASKGIGITAYSPLGSPDRPWAKKGEKTLMDEPKIQEIGAKYGKSSAQVLIKYQAARGNIVIPKSVTKERILSNIDIFDFELSPADIEAIEGFNRDHRFLGLVDVMDHPYHPFKA